MRQASGELSIMCMGCAEAVLMNSDGKTPDTTEATIYVLGFAVWFFLLAHFGKKSASRAPFLGLLERLHSNIKTVNRI